MIANAKSAGAAKLNSVTVNIGNMPEEEERGAIYGWRITGPPALRQAIDGLAAKKRKRSAESFGSDCSDSDMDDNMDL